MSTHNHIPRTAEACLDARLAPFQRPEPRRLLEDLDIEASRAVAPVARQRPTLINDLKLLFAALGAGGSVVPMGDNRRAARLLARYAESLRDH
jgi:hypothetical protein